MTTSIDPNYKLQGDEETVHHAIIDLYELHDSPAVTAADVASYTGLALEAVEEAMEMLCQVGILTYGTDAVVLGIDNLGYDPISEQEEEAE